MTSDAPMPKKNYQAILWDNDGVLVDTERLYYRATREILAGLGIDLTLRSYHEYFLVTAQGTQPLLEKIGYGPEAVEEVRERRNRLYLEMLEREPILVDGVENALASLRPHFAMGIVTSSRRDHFEAIHRRTGYLKYFDFVLAQDDYAQSKPAPDPYLAAIAKCGFPADQCLAIEDTPRGLTAARAAGVDCWMVRSELSQFADFSEAQGVFDSVGAMAAKLMS